MKTLMRKNESAVPNQVFAGETPESSATAEPYERDAVAEPGGGPGVKTGRGDPGSCFSSYQKGRAIPLQRLINSRNALAASIIMGEVLNNRGGRKRRTIRQWL